VGACNPPTDPGRVPLSPRLLRHTPLLLVDFPAPVSLHQIYGTCARSLLRLVPAYRAHAEPMAKVRRRRRKAEGRGYRGSSRREEGRDDTCMANWRVLGKSSYAF